MSVTSPTAVEQRVLEAERGLAPHARVSRAAAMLVWARGLIARQIQADRGAMSAERLKWEIAMRMYGNDASARAMIQRKLERVSA